MSKTGSRLLIGGGVLLALAVVAAVVVLNQLGRLIERGVETAGPKMTGTDVSLGGATVSIFSGEGALRNLEIGNPEGFTTDEAFDLGRIEVKIDPKSVAGGVIRVRSIVVDGPKLVAEFDANGRSNLKTIMSNVRAAAAGGGAKQGADDSGTQTRMIIDDFKFLNAEVRALAPAFELDKTLKLRAVELKNLGARQGGAAASDLANQVLRPIVDAAVAAAMAEYLAKQREKLGQKAEEKLMEKLFK
jgi:uncharacterized protein involved in outer membrane biogenesis